MTNWYVIKWTKMRNDYANLLHVVRRGGKLGPQAGARCGSDVFHIATAEAIVLGVANHKVFLFAGAIYKIYPANAAVVFDFIFPIAKVVAESNSLI